MTTTSVGQQLSCRVLGPLELTVDGALVLVSGTLVRRLLAALVLADNHAVPDDELMELLWPGQQETKALRVVVWRLRTALGSASDRLERTPTGYRFLLPEQTDQHRFTDLVSTGLRQQSTGEPTAAIATLSTALNLWHGTPWHDLTPVARPGPGTEVAAGSESESEASAAAGAGAWAGDRAGEVVGAGLVRRRLAGERARLLELRELAVEERAAARLAVGSPWPVIRTLSQLVADSPYRERRWELLALALHAAGRPDRAAAELRRYRLILAGTLGLDPGPILTALEHRLARPRSAPRHLTWRWR